MIDKSFHISVAQLPLIPAREDSWDTYLDYIRHMKADRVFISAPYDNICRITPEVKRRYGHLYRFDHEELELYTSDTPDLKLFQLWSSILKEKIRFFGEHGIETAFWIGHTIGHGGYLAAGDMNVFQPLVGADGTESRGCYCPLDVNFSKYICDALSIIAASGVGLILLDDDFRLNLHGTEFTVGCFCPRHMAGFEKATGLALTREELVSKVFCGKPNEIRRLWLENTGGSMMAFAASIEKAVHKINPSARIGLATAMSMWSHEGVDMKELLSCLAGGTRPFLRTIGAPYWSKVPDHAGWIIEYTRLQAHWMAGTDVEMLAEGDTFPHTRFHCPAAMLHAFQQGLLASGFKRIMNYAFPFSPPPWHEDGYMQKTGEALENYQAISEFFPDGYIDIGLNVVHEPNHFLHMTLPGNYDGGRLAWPDEPVELKYLSRLGVPVAFGTGKGPVILTGSTPEGISALELSSLAKQGLLLDAVAAECLLKRGYDIGVSSIRSAPVPRFERFSDEESCGRFSGHDVWLLANGDKTFFNMIPAGNAKVISHFTGNTPDENFPAVILYENKNGERFCIYAFDFREAQNSLQVMFNYARQEQMIRCIQWVGKDTAIVCTGGYPDMHVICRQSRDGARTAIALQNLHLDPVKEPVVRLSPSIKTGRTLELLMPDSVRAILTEDFTCKFENNQICLKINTIIPPMGMLGIGITSV